MRTGAEPETTMAERSSTSDRQALAAHLRAQVPALLAKWRIAIAADWQLLVGGSLPRSQLEDHIPRMARGLCS
jgi:hypothetical protein